MTNCRVLCVAWLFAALVAANLAWFWMPVAGSVATAEVSPAADPYADNFAEARSRTDSPFVLGILEDDIITPEEYEAAVDRYVACMADNGYEVTLREDLFVPGLHTYEGMIYRTLPHADSSPFATPGPHDAASQESAFNEMQAVADACARDSTMVIEALYGSIITYPNDEDPLPLILMCLKSNALLPEDYTVDQWQTSSETGEWPEGIWTGTLEFNACLSNPLAWTEDSATPIPSWSGI